MSEEEMIEETSEEFIEEDEEKLPFAKAEVVRLMKENLDDDKMIRERVKVEINKFLGDVIHTPTLKESIRKKKESYCI